MAVPAGRVRVPRAERLGGHRAVQQYWIEVTIWATVTVLGLAGCVWAGVLWWLVYFAP